MKPLRTMVYGLRTRAARRGQIAIGFLIVMVAGLVFVMAVLNLGQMAQVRVETSNAADAGALAGASWIASGQNEAALISRKMLDSVAMVQAIYLVPFCPGEQQRAYAEALWMSLDVDPVNLPPPGRNVRPGPVGYFKEVAEDALYAAWYTGARELLTASVNNMMIRFGDGPSACTYGAGGSLSCQPTLSDLSQNIRDQQNAQQSGANPWGGNNFILANLNWNNGLPAGDPANLTHRPKYAMRYPNRPPSLDIDDLPATYYQYDTPPLLPIFPEPLFHCEFEGRGIRTGVGDPNLPLAEIPDHLADFSQNPLEMVHRLGIWRKGWDVDVAPMIPRITQLNTGTCRTPAGDPQHVCGMRSHTLAGQPLVAAGFVNGTGQVEVTVSHEVQTAQGVTGILASSTPVPDLVQRFEPVASRAVARYTPASTFPVDPRARAELVQAE